jgi:hypothetical protein
MPVVLVAAELVAEGIPAEQAAVGLAAVPVAEDMPEQARVRVVSTQVHLPVFQ